MCDVNETLNATWLYDPTTNQWTPSAPLTGDVQQFTATLSPDGKVVVLSSRVKPQLYDPATNTWTAVGSTELMDQRLHSATLLPSGSVLIAGGLTDGPGRPEYTSQARAYDPATNRWTAVAKMAVARNAHTATLLPGGKVLVAGEPDKKTGNNMLEPIDDAELYDPATDRWAPAGTMRGSHREPSATVLPSGKVLLVGESAAYGSAPPVDAELYDPGTNTWSVANAPQASPRAGHTATLLRSGKVLVTGGEAGHFFVTPSAELYDPHTDTWSAAGLMALGRYEHTATLLPNGKVLVVGGGDNLNSTPAVAAELYDPATNTWAFTGPLGSQSAERPMPSR